MRFDRSRRVRWFWLCASLAMLSCADRESGEASPPADAADVVAPAPDPVARNAGKEAYFGDLHVHTSWSLDAFAFQVRVGPEDAYRFARGEAIDHVSGEKIRLNGPPLDFLALTEHANYLGIPSEAQRPGSPIGEIELIRQLLDDDPARSGPAIQRVLSHLGTDTPIPELDRGPVVESTWQRLIDFAEQYNDPGTFSTFVAYEYTAMPEGQNLHRNVVFRGTEVPSRPFSAFDSQDPADLWAWMDAARESGSDVIAIPHNANGSNGLMYPRVDRSGDPVDADYASTRTRNEPVSEIIQIKGQSETHPLLSPNDEWAAFAMLDTILGRPMDKSQPDGSYSRRALMTGLEMEEALGFNPYRFGVIGSSDGHNASSPVEEDNFTGKIGVADGTPEARIPLPNADAFDLDLGSDLSAGSPFSAAGLAGIWAEANTREDLFDALRAREVFATSGPRISVRLFGGWDLAARDLELDASSSLRTRAVSMGGVLAPSAEAGAPTFLAQAMQDPREARLERLQIIKGWVGEDGQAQERVYDIACGDGASPDPERHRCGFAAAAPDPRDCRVPTDGGRAELTAVWSDPDFDPEQRSFYYMRALQVPTCRWSSWEAIRMGVPPPAGAQATLQERAVSSPIWYAQ